MKIGKTISLVVMAILTIASLSYAYSVMVNVVQIPLDTDTVVNRTEAAVAQGQTAVDPNRGRGDRGSIYHAWHAIVAAGLTRITTAEFEKLSNWSARTRGYELEGLVQIGVLKPAGKGIYDVVITATPEQIDEINRQATTIVNKKRGDGTAVGIDGYRIDEAYLGMDKLTSLRQLVEKVTGKTVSVAADLPLDVVKELIEDTQRISAAAVIDDRREFTIEGQKPNAFEGITGKTDLPAVLASLVDMRLLEPQAQAIENKAPDFKETKYKTVLFKADFVTSDPVKFAEAYQEEVASKQDTIAVIISTSDDPMELAIKAALEEVQLSTQWGNRIIVLGVQPGSPAATAFANLFGANNIIGDLNTAKKILDNKEAVEAIGGAV